MVASNDKHSLNSETKNIQLIKTSWSKVNSASFAPRPTPGRGLRRSMFVVGEECVVPASSTYPSAPRLRCTNQFLIDQAWSRAETRGKRRREGFSLTGGVTSWPTVRSLGPCSCGHHGGFSRGGHWARSHGDESSCISLCVCSPVTCPTPVAHPDVLCSVIPPAPLRLKVAPGSLSLRWGPTWFTRNVSTSRPAVRGRVVSSSVAQRLPLHCCV